MSMAHKSHGPCGGQGKIKDFRGDCRNLGGFKGYYRRIREIKGCVKGD
jgi:hypothetical protein